MGQGYHPEEFPGFLVLLICACFVGPLITDMVRETIKTAPAAVDTRLQKYTYLGRDDEGRPEWSYGYE
jgi:hypothetical protein